MKALLPSIALLLCACGSDVTPPPTPVRLPELEQLCRRIDRLVESLERSTTPATAEGRTGADHAERTAADQTVAALQQRVAELEGELDILRMQTAMAAGTLAATPRPAQIAPLNKEAVHRLSKRHQRDRNDDSNETLAELLLMGPAQVLQLLGMPTSTYLPERGGVRWDYELDDDSLYVVFVNGQVMDVHH